MAAPLTDDEFRLFNEWLGREYGLRFGPEKREILRARLEPRRVALGLETFDELLFRVRYHPDRHAERAALIPHLTNNESYFFREKGQLDVLREEVLPSVAAESRGRPIRLLSAGSASGEEPYTLAILARETLGRGARVEVTGMDVDIEALERAREGLYRSHAFRGLEEGVRRRYFRPEGERWRLAKEIRSAARFKHGNLVDPAWSSDLAPQDIVFCRNVLIYFDEEAMRRAVDNLYRAIRPGGYLFLGHAESLSRIPSRFAPERRPGAVFHRRPEE